MLAVGADYLPQLLRREWGFAPLCRAAATLVAALKTPVASEGGEGLPGRETFIKFYRKEIIRNCQKFRSEIRYIQLERIRNNNISDINFWQFLVISFR